MTARLGGGKKRPPDKKNYADNVPYSFQPYLTKDEGPLLMPITGRMKKWITTEPRAREKKKKKWDEGLGMDRA